MELNIEYENKAGLRTVCAMTERPFLRNNRCREEAVIRLTEGAWHEYQNYRIRYYKARPEGTHTKDLPMLLRPVVCRKHYNGILQLNENPKEEANSWQR